MDLAHKRIVAIIAHPDDETIGCGGFLHKAASLGASCKVILPIKRGDPRGLANWDLLLQQFQNACTYLGAEAILTSEQVCDLTADHHILKIYELILEHINWADIVLCHWQGDTHQAHKAVYRAVELATRPFRNPKTVLCFEIATSTDQGFVQTFSPNCFVELSARDVSQKTKAMAQYTTEIVAGRAPMNLENQMRLRGSQIGTEFAEAFVIARHFIR